MTKRFLAGLHPAYGTYGIWLSKPGVDVSLVGADDDFLLKPDVKFEQIVLSGLVVVGVASFTTVFLPVTLASKPFIWMHGNINSNLDYPCDLNARGAAAPESNEQNFSIIHFTDKFQVFNNSPDQILYGFYMVFHRTII